MTIDERFHAAVRELDGEVDRTHPPTLQHRTTMPSSNPFSGPLLAVVGALVLVLSFIAIPRMLGGNEGEDVAPAETPASEDPPVSDDESAPGDAELAQAGGPSPSLVAPAITWERLELPGGTGIDRAEKAVAMVDCPDEGACTLNGFVAVGSGASGISRSGMVWISVDGSNWTRTALLGADNADHHVHDVAYDRGILVAVGGQDPLGGQDPNAFGGLSSEGPFVPMIWMSEDLGSTWSAVMEGIDPTEGGVSDVVRTVVATDTGFLAAGSGGTWSSTDGVSWAREKVGGDGTFDWIAQWSMGFLASGGGGWDVPVTLWRSEDGSTWSNAATLGLAPEGRDPWPDLVGVVEGQDGWLIAGDSVSSVPVWRSSDGVLWEPIEPAANSADVAALPWGATSVVPLDEGVAVFGLYGGGGTSSRGVGAWTDGTGLAGISMPSEFFGQLSGETSWIAGASTYVDPRSGLTHVLLAGSTSDGGESSWDSRPVVWIGTVNP